MKEIVRLGVVLLIVSAIAAVALAITNDLTKDQILAQRELANEEARRNILPDAERFELIDENLLQDIKSSNENIVEVYKGFKGDSIAGYTIKAISNGYGGPLEVMTGISVDGVITGVRVGNHSETPGLGANASTPGFYTQYDNKSIDNKLVVVKNPPTQDNEVQAISGATITSNAVTTGVNYAIEVYTKFLNSNLSAEEVMKHKENEFKELKKSLLVEAKIFEPIDNSILENIKTINGNVLEIYEGFSENAAKIGYIFKTFANGYNGKIEVLTSIDTEGKIKGVTVVNHQETIGVGTESMTPEFYSQFNNKSAHDALKVTKSNSPIQNEILVISGATITSSAITNAVNHAIEIFRNVLAQ